MAAHGVSLAAYAPSLLQRRRAPPRVQRKAGGGGGIYLRLPRNSYTSSQHYCNYYCTTRLLTYPHYPHYVRTALTVPLLSSPFLSSSLVLPISPLYYTQVCLGAFTCPPPTRHELMQSFTGSELAALIVPGCVIGAHQVFSDELERQIADLPPFARSMSSYEHWIRGCYLITRVDADDDGEMRIPVDDEAYLTMFKARLGDELAFNIEGKRLKLIPGGALEGVPVEGLKDALDALSPPAVLHIAAAVPSTVGDDHIAAVNLTRPIEPRNAGQVKAAVKAAVAAQGAAAREVEITHYNGGPCEDDEIVCCVSYIKECVLKS